jgi:hypothetical protein
LVDQLLAEFRAPAIPTSHLLLGCSCQLADPKQKRHDWWEFAPTVPVPLTFAVAVTGEHYSLITTELGADIAPVKRHVDQ